MSGVLKFTARLIPYGAGYTAFLHCPFDVQKTFGTRGRVPVCGTINGFPYRSSIMPMGGKHVMCINAAMRAGANVKHGDTARFVMQRDDKPRTVTIPPALKKALAKNPAAKAAFTNRSYTHRKEHARWIAEAKQPETIQRRLAKLIPMLLKKKPKRTATAPGKSAVKKAKPVSEKHKQRALWAADRAEKVLPIFEKLHPRDTRPRKAIAAARDWTDGKINCAAARAAASAAHAAARSAKTKEATAAARAAGHAAATAHAITHALAVPLYAARARGKPIKFPHVVRTKQ